MSRKNTLEWSDLDKQAQAVIIGLGVYEVIEKLVTWHFIYHTPKERTRGSKWMWIALSFFNFVGPAAYFLRGRRQN